MCRYSLLASSALAAALALGCSDGESPTALDIASVPPSQSVARHTEFFGFGFGDENFLIIAGGSAENWANFCATGEENWDPWRILTVERPDGSLKETWVGDDQHALVWELPADPCAAPPDYTGTARTLLTDSDVLLDGQGTDASGLRINGTVTDANRQEYHLHGNFLLSVPRKYDSLDNFVVIWRVQRVQLSALGR